MLLFCPGSTTATPYQDEQARATARSKQSINGSRTCLLFCSRRPCYRHRCLLWRHVPRCGASWSNICQWRGRCGGAAARNAGSCQRDAACLALAPNTKFQIDYVVVVFGGAAGYPDDDLNKILWMAQAAGAAAPPLLTDHGEFRVDNDANPALYRSLLYRWGFTATRCVLVSLGFTLLAGFRTIGSALCIKVHTHLPCLRH